MDSTPFVSIVNGSDGNVFVIVRQTTADGRLTEMASIVSSASYRVDCCHCQGRLGTVWLFLGPFHTRCHHW